MPSLTSDVLVGLMRHLYDTFGNRGAWHVEPWLCALRKGFYMPGVAQMFRNGGKLVGLPYSVGRYREATGEGNSAVLTCASPLCSLSLS